MFQAAITRSRQPSGLIGTAAVKGPQQVAPFTPDNFATSNPRIVGRLYTYNEQGQVILGFDPAIDPAEIRIAGLLVSPHEYVAPGSGLGQEFNDGAYMAGVPGLIREDATVQLSIKGEWWVECANTGASTVIGNASVALQRDGKLQFVPSGQTAPADTWVIPNARTWRTSSVAPGQTDLDVFIVSLNG